MEQKCTDWGDECVMSEPFQSTSYTRTDFGSNYALFTGDQSGSKIGFLNHPASGTASIAAHDTLSNTFAGNYTIVEDSSILNLLPNRDPATVARFLRADTWGDPGSQHGAHRFGYCSIPLGTTVKRIAMRWYTYVTPAFDFTWENSCTNYKIAHISGTEWGGNGPLLTLWSGSSDNKFYSFTPAYGWYYNGLGSFDGFGDVQPRPGAATNPADQKGTWTRHELVARRPRVADSRDGGLGFDFSYFVKNITDGSPDEFTDEIEDFRFSSGCAGCLSGGSDFVWSAANVYPATEDVNSLHTEVFREGSCQGKVGWLYAMVAKWDTDAGQRIGAAYEVEGGSGGSLLSRLHTEGLFAGA
jgi:hypothetical protein